MEIFRYSVKLAIKWCMKSNRDNRTSLSCDQSRRINHRIAVCRTISRERNLHLLSSPLSVSFDRRDQAYTLWNADMGPQEY